MYARGIQPLLFPVADILQMDFEFKDGILTGEQEVLPYWLPTPKGIVPKVVGASVDAAVGTAGILLHVSGSLYMAIISDLREELLTVFLVNGPKAGIKRNTAGRVESWDKQKNFWSRKKFYGLIAPGVLATYERGYSHTDWKKTSTGSKAAMDYVESRTTGMSSSEANAQTQKERMRALTGK